MDRFLYPCIVYVTYHDSKLQVGGIVYWNHIPYMSVVYRQRRKTPGCIMLQENNKKLRADAAMDM